MSAKCCLFSSKPSTACSDGVRSHSLRAPGCLPSIHGLGSLSAFRSLNALRSSATFHDCRPTHLHILIQETVNTTLTIKVSSHTSFPKSELTPVNSITKVAWLKFLSRSWKLSFLKYLPKLCLKPNYLVYWVVGY
jgi:hypothetical protein